MNKKNKKETKPLNGNYSLALLLFVLCVIPLLMRLYVYYPGLNLLAWFPDIKQQTDVFLHCKSVALTAVFVIMSVVLGIAVYIDYKSRNRNQNFNKLLHAKWLIPLGVFAVFAFLSTIFSKYRSYGFSGLYEQFESIWVVLAYCLIALFAFYFIKTREDLDVIRKGLFVFLAIIGAIGISQLIGKDFWESDLGKSLFIPTKYANFMDSINFKESGSGNHQVYLTFYNPNYVGVFASLTLPISIMASIGVKALPKKIAWGIVSLVIFLCALGCGSKAFLLSLIVPLLIGVVFFMKKRLHVLPIAVAVLSVFLAAGDIYLTYVNVDVVKYIKKALTTSENSYKVEDFAIDNDHVTITYLGNALHMTCESVGKWGNFSFTAYDDTNNPVEHTISDKNVITFNDARFKAIKVSILDAHNEYPYIAQVKVAGVTHNFSKNADGYTYINLMYKADIIEKADAAIFTNYDRLASGRGYLWSRSIPLLKDSLILGTGADSFLFVFPQNDYVAKANAGYNDNIITKPHSIYLQIGIQYGVPALIAYIALIILYIIQTAKICWHSEYKDSCSCCALGILLGIIGYSIMGITNDSCVALTPIAWLMLGMGFAINHILIKEKNAN